MEKTKILDRETKNESRLDQKFRYALNLTIDKYIHSIKFTFFKEKFYHLYQKEQLNLERIHHQLQMQLKSQMKTYASALYSAHKISALILAFEKTAVLIQKSLSDEIVLGQTDSIDSVTKDKPFSKEEYRDQLKLYLLKLSSENDDTEKTVFKNHEEILHLKERICNLNKEVCGFLDDLRDCVNSKLKKICVKLL